MEIAALSVDRGETSEYELTVDVAAVLVGDRGPVAIERRYEGLPRQNDTVDRGAVDTDDRLVADAATVHVHTKFYGLDDTEGTQLGPDEAIDAGDFLRDDHTTWEPTDHSVLTDGESFEAACRAHVEETASATYERGVDAR